MARQLSFQIHLTDDCNLGCLHCYGKKGGMYLGSDEFDYILDNVLDYMTSLGAVPGKVVFCGGEPTLSPILVESISKCVNVGFRRVSILSNGLLITNELAGNLVRAGCEEIQICLEGTRDTHNEIRNGTWNAVLKAWDICRSNGMMVKSQTSVNPLNYREIEEIIRNCRGRVHRTMFLRHIPHQNGLAALTRSQWTEVLERLIHCYMNYGKRYEGFVLIRDILWSRLFCDIPYNCGFRQEKPLGVIIESNGDVHICRRAGVVVGNIFAMGLDEIYRENSLLQQCRKGENLGGRCGTCSRSASCGGCRGMALAVNGDFCAEDPHCMAEELHEPVGEHSRLNGDFIPALWEAVNDRFVARIAEKKGIGISAEELQQAADAFRMAHGLYGSEETATWLKANGMTIAEFEAYLEKILLRQKMRC